PPETFTGPSTAARRSVHALLRNADIFVESLRPQLAAREGYAAEDLAAVRPGLIYARIKLNTPAGPWANWVGLTSALARLRAATPPRAAANSHDCQEA